MSHTPRICFDIDGVVASGTVSEVYSDEAGWAFDKCLPITETVELIKRLAEAGCDIVLMTARYEEDRAKTVAWLDRHDIPYSKLVMDKPNADLYVDDKNYPEPFVPNALGHYSKILMEVKRHVGRRRLD